MKSSHIRQAIETVVVIFALLLSGYLGGNF